MPSKNIIKTFYNGGIYHAYNRGVEKRVVFVDERDYKMFIYYLRLYLTSGIEGFMLRQWNHRDLSRSVELLCYCLMPNHYHILLRQQEEGAITELMRRVMSGYTRYFNERWGRVGPLFQGKYKAALIKTDEQLIHISRYIHLNPAKVNLAFADYQYSSYRPYLMEDTPSWLFIGPVLELFEGPEQYQSFVTDTSHDSSRVLSGIVIEDFKGPTLAKVGPLKEPL